jgi:hypothetical protein
MMPEPKYGHAYCTCCSVEIDLSVQPRCFSGTFSSFSKSDELILFFMCSSCADEYEYGDFHEQQTMAKKAALQIKDLPKNFYAQVTLSALIVNDYDLVRAYEIGVNLPKEIIAQFQSGEISGDELYALAMLKELDVLMEGTHGLS